MELSSGLPSSTTSNFTLTSLRPAAHRSLPVAMLRYQIQDETVLSGATTVLLASPASTVCGDPDTVAWDDEIWLEESHGEETVVWDD